MKDSFSKIQKHFGSIQYATWLRASLSPLSLKTVSLSARESSSELRLICLIRREWGSWLAIHSSSRFVWMSYNMLKQWCWSDWSWTVGRPKWQHSWSVELCCISCVIFISLTVQFVESAILCKYVPRITVCCLNFANNIMFVLYMIKEKVDHID